MSAQLQTLRRWLKQRDILSSGKRIVSAFINRKDDNIACCSRKKL